MSETTDKPVFDLPGPRLTSAKTGEAAAVIAAAAASAAVAGASRLGAGADYVSHLATTVAHGPAVVEAAAVEGGVVTARRVGVFGTFAGLEGR